MDKKTSKSAAPLSNEELVKKYESGKINLSKTLLKDFKVQTKNSRKASK